MSIDIAENIKAVQAKIEAAARKSGRSAEDITLVAVTKTRTPEEMNRAIAAGLTDIGENKVQEIENKYDEVNTEGLRWHFIGHLQRNKVKYIITKADLIHSVDSLRLAEEINRRAAEAGRIIDVLIQVNVAREESKFGVTTDEVSRLIESVAETCANIKVTGLMCIAPAADNPEDVRGVFCSAKKLFDEIPGLKWLSMGMTHDYEVAIEEGSNIVRVGTGIFGERNYAQHV
jgi:pyridoxal phosphate enzyme (YggS family)